MSVIYVDSSSGNDKPSAYMKLIICLKEYRTSLIPEIHKECNFTYYFPYVKSSVLQCLWTSESIFNTRCLPLKLKFIFHLCRIILPCQDSRKQDFLNDIFRLVTMGKICQRGFHLHVLHLRLLGHLQWGSYLLGPHQNNQWAIPWIIRWSEHKYSDN